MSCLPCSRASIKLTELAAAMGIRPYWRSS
jgi:hypothetical protein